MGPTSADASSADAISNTNPATDPPGTALPSERLVVSLGLLFLPSHQDYRQHITELKGARRSARNRQTRWLA
jgi:hypothetical protein